MTFWVISCCREISKNKTRNEFNEPHPRFVSLFVAFKFSVCSLYSYQERWLLFRENQEEPKEEKKERTCSIGSSQKFRHCCSAKSDWRSIEAFFSSTKTIARRFPGYCWTECMNLNWMLSFRQCEYVNWPQL